MAERPVDGVPLREYVEAVMEQSQRALEMAERVRDSAAEVLREQTQKALDKADVEREKAARALREELTRQIEQGDTSLRDHIRTQIEQIKLLATSLDDQARLRIDGAADSVERVEKAAEQHVAQLRREREMVTSAQQDAIAKAEVATEKRFEGVNELRAQMNDLILSHQQAINTLTEKLMLREVADAQFADLRQKLDVGRDEVGGKLPREVFDRTLSEWSEWRSGVDKRLASSTGLRQGETESKTSSNVEAQLALAKGGLIVGAIGLVITVVLAANGVFG